MKANSEVKNQTDGFRGQKGNWVQLFSGAD